jgi:hypothetical protein
MMNPEKPFRYLNIPACFIIRASSFRGDSFLVDERN